MTTPDTVTSSRSTTSMRSICIATSGTCSTGIRCGRRYPACGLSVTINVYAAVVERHPDPGGGGEGAGPPQNAAARAGTRAAAEADGGAGRNTSTNYTTSGATHAPARTSTTGVAA